jgi:ABC-type branched-subunit amino acid transport system ATPase component/predicted MFS family arabinose efflux permease
VTGRAGDELSSLSSLSSLTGRVLEEDERRRALLAADSPAITDDQLAGVGADAMAWQEVVRRGGVATIGVLSALVLVDALDNTAFGVLAPDIQKTLHLTDTTIGVVGALGGLVVFLAAIPLGYLGDRTRRVSIIGACTLLWAGFAVLTGIVQQLWQLVFTRTVAGVGKANELPVQSSVLADAYPIEGRARVFALTRASQSVGYVIGPILAGTIAAVAGGGAGWRWVFPALALPAGLLGLLTIGLREPRRGTHEMMAILGEELPPDAEPAPISISAAFARLKKIKTFYYLVVCLAVLGLALVAAPIYVNLFLRDHYGLGASGRGLVGTLTAVGGTVGVFVGGTSGDRLFRRAPERAAALTGGLVVAYGLVAALALTMPNAVLYTVLSALAAGCVFAAFVVIQLIGSSVAPYRLRSMAFAMLGLYLSLVGGLFGAVLVGELASSWGKRTALEVVTLVVGLVGGGLVINGARHVRDDMAAASADLVEERDERERVAAGGAVPVLQVRGVDFSYGPVQVLFDIDLDVWAGEVLALLGTNGAGKSTLLRVISGLGYADTGVVRLGGRTITYAEPSTRTELGIVQVAGGRAVFPALSVRENLRAGGFSIRRDPAGLDRKIHEVVALFPVLGERMDQPAGRLSGGEQQMLALAGALLLDPKVLLIDELSLGLAPVVVEQLLAIVEQLKARGLTMVIVEQSVNVALSIADRAVFMEKGQIRFEGSAQDLVKRDDLVRAVFLGGEGG